MFSLSPWNPFPTPQTRHSSTLARRKWKSGSGGLRIISPNEFSIQMRRRNKVGAGLGYRLQFRIRNEEVREREREEGNKRKIKREPRKFSAFLIKYSQVSGPSMPFHWITIIIIISAERSPGGLYNMNRKTKNPPKSGNLQGLNKLSHSNPCLSFLQVQASIVSSIGSVFKT